MLWLKWFVGFLDAAGAFAPISHQVEEAGHAWLNRIERVMLAIVKLRAAPRVRCIKAHRPFAAHRLKERGLRRAVIGAAMRRALRRRDLHRRIEALSQSIDSLVARLLKRLARGLTRRRPIIPAPPPNALPAVAAFVLMPSADTS